MKKHSKVAIVLLLSAISTSILAAPRELPLRLEGGTCIYQGSSSQTVETNYGASVATLCFSGTTTYDFYSPSLVSPIALTTANKGGGKIYMQNTSASHANDFQVTGQMKFYDYDPATGIQTLIVDTGASMFKDCNAGQIVNWALPNVLLPANKTVPVGHLLHVALTLGLVSGNPAGYGQLLYNGSRTTSSAAFLSEDNGPAWNFGAPIVPSQMCSLQVLGDGCAKLTSQALPNQVYVVQATPGLLSPTWVTIGTNITGADGLFQFVDTDAPNFPTRFYRLGTP
jgi:hypothetical protein